MIFLKESQRAYSVKIAYLHQFRANPALPDRGNFPCAVVWVNVSLSGSLYETAAQKELNSRQKHEH